MAEREYFPCYHSYLKKCEKLTDQELGRLFRALMEYSVTGERQELAGRESIAFDFIADDIDRANDAYLEKCEKNSQNGKRGGRPEKRPVSEKPNGFEKSQSKDKSKGQSKDKSEKETPPTGVGGAKKAPADAALPPARDRRGLVFLSDVQYAALAADLGEPELQRCVDYLSEYCAMHGRRYRDWSAAVRRCSREKWGLATPKTGGPGVDFQPDAARIQKNADWLDSFLAGQEEEA